MEVKITKYEPYPEEAPIGMAVGFLIKSKTDRIFYRDTVIEYDERFEDDDAYLYEAWTSLKEEAFEEVERLDKQHKILGAKWSVSKEEIVETPVEEPTEEPIRDPETLEEFEHGEDPIEEGDI